MRETKPTRDETNDAQGELPPEPVLDVRPPARPGPAIILEALGRSPVAMTRAELHAILVAERPDVSRNLTSVSLSTLQERGKVEKAGDGYWRLVGSDVRAPASASSQVEEEETPRLGEPPAAAASAPRASRPAPSPPRPARAPEFVPVPLSPPMARALDRLVASGFHGATIEEAAERILARELERMAS